MILSSERTEREKWWKAYNLMFEMMELRGFTAEQHVRILNRQQFKDRFFETIDNPKEEGERYVAFVKESEHMRLYFGFYTSIINKDSTSKINAYLENLVLEFNPIEEQEENPDRFAIQIELIVVVQNINSYHALYALKNLAPDIIPRNKRNPHIAKGFIRVLELEKEFQTNPMNHIMNSQMVMITDEDEKEKLRRRLLANEVDKNVPLSRLLPKIHMFNPIARWYGAQVGDVFYCVRTLGGETPYYRIVAPPRL